MWAISVFCALAASFSVSINAQTVDVTWGSTCSYTPEFRSGDVELFLDEEELLSVIPANKDKVFIDLSAHADLDTKIVASDGTILLEYKRGAGWTGGCVICPESQTFSYNGMNFETCVDKCVASTTFTYRDGTVWNLHGSADYAEEWIYIDHTTEDLTLSLVGFEAGAGTIKWLWDCPMDCDTCLPYGEEVTDDKTPVVPEAPSVCFHGDVVVTLESGDLRTLAEVQIGDSILSADDKGNFSFAPVLELPHKKNSELVEFLELSTEKGKMLSLTPDHLLPRCSGEVVTARAMAIGDCVLTVDGPESLESVVSSHKAGVYTAITKNKFIVVGDIVASPYGQERDTEREFQREKRRNERQVERKLARAHN